MLKILGVFFLQIKPQIVERRYTLPFNDMSHILLFKVICRYNFKAKLDEKYFITNNFDHYFNGFY